MQNGGLVAKSKKKERELPEYGTVFDGDKIVPLDSCSQPRMVFTLSLNNEISNRRDLYCAIPVGPKEFYQDGDVTSIRFDGNRKGNPGGFFPHAMMMDIYNDGKDRKVNVFRTGILGICGMSSKSMSKRLGQLVCQILNNNNDYLESLKGIKGMKTTLRWLRGTSKGEEFLLLNTVRLKKDKEFGNMEFGAWVSEHRIVWPESNEYDNVLNLIKPMFLDLLEEEDAPHVVMLERIELLKEAIKSKHVAPRYEVRSAKLSSLSYKYNLGFCIDRYKLCEVLMRLGYSVDFPNDATAIVTVNIKTNDLLDNKKVNKKDMTSSQNIAFYPGGSIKHNGPTKSIVRETYYKLITDLLEYREEIMLVDKKK